MELLDRFRIQLTRTEILGGWDAWSLIPFALMILAVISAVGYFVYSHLFAPDDTPDRRVVGRGQSLFMQSLSVIREDPETLVFSAAAAVLSLLPPCFTVLLLRSEQGLVRFGGIAFWFGGSDVGGVEKIRGLEAIFLTALFCYVCGGFLSLGVLGCALKRLSGGEPSLFDGIRAMRDSAAAMAEYALIGAVAMTGMVMFAPANWLARFSLQTVWTATQLYVLPVMISEKLGAADSIRRSNEVALDSPVQDAWLLIGDDIAFTVTSTAGFVVFFAMLILSITGCVVPQSSLTTVLLAELTVLPACLAAASAGMFAATVYLVFLGGAYLLAVGQPGRCYEFFPVLKRMSEPV